MCRYNNKYFNESNVEVRPTRELDLIETGKEQYSPTDVEYNNGIGSKGYVQTYEWCKGIVINTLMTFSYPRLLGEGEENKGICTRTMSCLFICMSL